MFHFEHYLCISKERKIQLRPHSLYAVAWWHKIHYQTWSELGNLSLILTCHWSFRDLKQLRGTVYAEQTSRNLQQWKPASVLSGLWLLQGVGGGREPAGRDRSVLLLQGLPSFTYPLLRICEEAHYFCLQHSSDIPCWVVLLYHLFSNGWFKHMISCQVIWGKVTGKWEA